MIVLRELAATLGLDVNAKSFAKGEIAAHGVELALRKLVEWGKEAVDGFVEMIKSTAETGRELDRASQMTGITTEALQQLRFAADESGTGAESLSTGIFHLARTMQEAKKGTGDQTDAFSKLGVKVTDVHGKLRPADDVLGDLAEKFAKMPDGMDKTSQAIQVFGREGAAMIPMLNKGRDGLEELRKEAFVLSKEQIQAGKDFTSTQEAITRQTRNLWRSAVAPLLPAITALLKQYLAWKKENGEIMKQRIQTYIGYAIKVVKALGVALKAVIEISGMLWDNWVAQVKIVQRVMESFFNVIGSTGRTVLLGFAVVAFAAASPLLFLASVLGGVLLVLNSIRRYHQGKSSLFGLWKKTIDDWMKPNEGDPWFVSAIKSFVKLIQQAIDLIHEFDEATGRTSAKEIDRRAGASKGAIQQRADVFTTQAARTRASLGQSLTDAQRAALERQGVSEEAFVSKYQTMSPSVQVTQENNFTINPPPGMSAQQVGQVVHEKMQEFTDNVHENAAAALSE